MSRSATENKMLRVTTYSSYLFQNNDQRHEVEVALKLK